MPPDFAAFIADTLNAIYQEDADADPDYAKRISASDVDDTYRLWYRFMKGFTESGTLPPPVPYSSRPNCAKCGRRPSTTSRTSATSSRTPSTGVGFRHPLDLPHPGGAGRSGGDGGRGDRRRHRGGGHDARHRDDPLRRLPDLRAALQRLPDVPARRRAERPRLPDARAPRRAAAAAVHDPGLPGPDGRQRRRPSRRSSRCCASPPTS